MTFSPLIIWAKATFFFEQLFPVVARTWLEYKSDRLFLGPKFQFLAKKSDFCHTTPIFVDDPFLALDMTVNFPPWKQFFDFPIQSYSCFRKKIRLTAQKVFPPPTVGAPSASNSPSALRADWITKYSSHLRVVSPETALWFPHTRGRALILSLSGQWVQVVPRVPRSFLHFAL